MVLTQSSNLLKFFTALKQNHRKERSSPDILDGRKVPGACLMITLKTSFVSGTPPSWSYVLTSLLPALEENSEVDSEEENDEVELFLDEFNYPYLPPWGNMPLEKCKNTYRLYSTLSYSMTFLH